MSKNVDTIQCPDCGSILDIPKTEAEEKENKDWLEQYREMSKDMPGAPSVDQINELKHKYGNLYFIPFTKDSFYLYRPVSASEYEEIFTMMLKHVKEEDQRLQERTLNDLLVYKCTVFPKITPAVKKDLPAGTVPSLAHLIHLVSNFADPYTLSNLLYEL